MTITIGQGIKFGGGIAFTPRVTPFTQNLVVSYDAGDSMSYSGSGIGFNTEYTGPFLNSYVQDAVLDLAGLSGGPWNSGQLSGGINWTNHGSASYFSLNAVSASQFINSSYQQEAPVLFSPSYSIMALVRPKDFMNGAIACGDGGGPGKNFFTFAPNSGLNDGPALIAGNTFSGPGVIDTTTLYEIDTWYCVSVTYDSTTSEMKLYTNGVLVATGTGVDPIDGPTGLYWGTVGGFVWLTGDLAVCQAWDNRVLTALEISILSGGLLDRYVQPPATSSAVLTQTGDFYTWTVPEGVYSVSVLAVGAGGGGTGDDFATSGSDTYMYKNFEIFQTLAIGTSNQIIVDTASNPTVTNVTANGSWCVIGNPIGPNGAVDLVTNVEVDGANTVITIDQTVSSTAGDAFQFIECVVAAEGGYEINTYYYNQTNTDTGSPGATPYGSGARALPLVSDGPYGLGGVVDWYTTYPIGGGAAGGYGLPGLALNRGRSGSWIADATGGPFGNFYNTLAFSNNNLTVSALTGIDATNANQECMSVGTQIIPASSKIMYSVTIDDLSSVDGYCGIGLANYVENLQQYPGYSINSVGFYDDGRVFIDGDTVATYDNFGTGSIVDIAVDSGAGLAWFRVDAGSWNADGGADPATNTGGLDISAMFTSDPAVSLALSPWYNYVDDTFDTITIATASFYVVPDDYTFVPGVPGAGGQGGDGSGYFDSTNFAGVGGAGGGGGGRYEDSGSGGGGTGIYGRTTNGAAGGWIPDPIDGGIAAGGGSGSSHASGGQATPWNGGRGGYPGGAGGSGTGYWDGGNGGALSYRNNYEVIPGDTYTFQVGAGGQGQSDGGSGADGIIRIVWPGDTRQFPTTDVGVDHIAVPTLDITDSTFGGFSGSVTYNITSTGGSPILESGIVYGLLTENQYTNGIDICVAYSGTEVRVPLRTDESCSNPITTGQSGTVTQNLTSLYNFGGGSIDVYAYAVNAAGVAYSPTSLSWYIPPCLAEGTLITLADGSTKPIEDITINESLKVWDFDNGVATTAPVLWLKKKESTIQYNLCKFSDGSELKTIGQHRIFNQQAGKFTYPMTDDTPIGTITVKSDGTEITLTSKSVVYAEVNYYNIISAGHINCYANDILTSNRFNNIYPIADMQYVKDGRVVRNRSEFVGVSDRWLDGLRLTEQTIELKSLQKRISGYERNEKITPDVRAQPTWYKD